MQQRTIWAITLIAALCLAGAGAYWWSQQQAAPPLPAQAPPAAEAVPPPVAVASAPAAPAIRHPIDLADAASAPAATARLAPDATDASIADALAEALGRKGVLTYLSTDRFVSRVVATVDNLDRPQAAARLWPVNPIAGKFRTTAGAEATQISADNPARYVPFVKFIASTDTAQGVALYKAMYPQFQQAYEELGYPGKYFNDRLVKVIDHLLEAPELAGPIRVKLTEVKGPIESATPWLRYEYEEPALEARSAGQKMLMRMGAENARQLKAKLAQWRRAIARGPG